MPDDIRTGMEPMIVYLYKNKDEAGTKQSSFGWWQKAALYPEAGQRSLSQRIEPKVLRNKWNKISSKYSILERTGATWAVLESIWNCYVFGILLESSQSRKYCSRTLTSFGLVDLCGVDDWVACESWARWAFSGT